MVDQHSHQKYIKDILAFIELLYPPEEEDNSRKDQSLIIKLTEEYKMYKNNFARNIKFMSSSINLSMKYP